MCGAQSSCDGLPVEVHVELHAQRAAPRRSRVSRPSANVRRVAVAAASGSSLIRSLNFAQRAAARGSARRLRRRSPRGPGELPRPGCRACGTRGRGASRRSCGSRTAPGRSRGCCGPRPPARRRAAPTRSARRRPRLAGRPSARRRPELGARARRRGRGAPQRSARSSRRSSTGVRLGPPVGAPQRGAEVGEGAGVLEARRRALEHVDRLAQQLLDRSADVGQRHRAQRDADAARRAPTPRPLEVLAGQPPRAVPSPSGASAERGVRAPARGAAGWRGPTARRGGRTRPDRRRPPRPALGEPQWPRASSRKLRVGPGGIVAVDPALAQLRSASSSSPRSTSASMSTASASRRPSAIPCT